MTMDYKGSSSGPRLFEHVKRQQWGLAILARESPDSRSFQFEDGQMRTFKQPFLSLLREVKRPEHTARAVAVKLTRQLGSDGAPQEGQPTTDQQEESMLNAQIK